MLRTHRKLLPIIMATIIAATTAACSAGTGANPAPTTGAEGQSPAVQGNEQRPSIEIVLNNGSQKFPDGLSENDNPYIDYVREGTNIDVNLIFPPSDGYLESLSVMMASGDLPDMMYTSNASWFVDFARQGAFQPLDEWVEKHGADLKKNIPQAAWDNVTINGHIYAIPAINQVKGRELMYVRKDWLDRLGLSEPQTLEELKAVIKAFRDDDPDGNGIDDTFGTIFVENLDRTSPLLGAFGVQRGQWYEKDGQLVYSSIQPEMKAALQFLAELNKEQLVDPEWALNKTASLNEKVAGGKVGLFSATWSETRGNMLTNKQNDPAADWVPLPFPTGPDGRSGTIALNLVKGYNVVPAASEHAEDVVKLLNFINGEGQKSLSLGFENEVWKTENGQFTMNFEVHNAHLYRLTLSDIALPADMTYANLKTDALGLEFRLTENLQRISDNVITNAFVGAPTPGMGKYNANLKKLELEYFTKIAVGSAPIDDFDKFVAEWNQNGGEEITREVNEWYNCNTVRK